VQLRKRDQIRQTRYRAVIVHDFANHTGRVQPRKARTAASV
jgi:hypothetical protein